MRRETSRDVYVYALSSPGLPRRLSLLGRQLHCFGIGDVEAIVGRTARPGRNLEEIQLQHRIVAQLATRTPALLPARFGSVLAESALRSLVSERQDEIRAALRLVRNCEQMTLRVFGPSGTDAPSSPPSGSGTDYLIHRRERAHHQPPEVGVIRQELGALVKAERVETGDRGVRLVVYHLVARRMLSRYRRRASVLQTLLKPYAVTATGPWPAFAFAPELF